MADPGALQNDRFGCGVHSLVAHASPEQVRLVAEVREAVGQVGAVIPAHVTVRGTFYEIGSLDELRGLLQRQARNRPGLTLCQDCTRDQVEQAMASMAGLDISTGFSVDSVEFMGRVGPTFGGKWTLIGSLPLSAGISNTY